MISEKQKQKMNPWASMIFCAFLSLTAFIHKFCLGMSHYDGWIIPFLPMCFFFTGSQMSKMQFEISELKKQIATLTQNNCNEAN